MEKRKIVMPPPRQELIRIRYRAFLSAQDRILKSSKEACRRKIKELCGGG